MTVQWNHFSLSRYDTSQLSITILDVNDNAPLFRDSPYEIKVVENDEEGLDEIVFKAEAQDPDGRPFNRVEYALRDDYDGKEQPIRNIWFQKKKIHKPIFFAMRVIALTYWMRWPGMFGAIKDYRLQSHRLQ